MADNRITGILLVGGASSRFGSPKELAEYDGEKLGDRAWRLLGEVCDDRVAVGKRGGGLELAFPLLDDGTEVRAPLAGLVAGLRAAKNDVAVVIPVDMPLLDAASLRALAAACRDAAVPQSGPLPGAYRKSALPVLEAALGSGNLKLRDAVAHLDAACIKLPEAVLANINDRDDLQRLQ